MTQRVACLILPYSVTAQRVSRPLQQLQWKPFVFFDGILWPDADGHALRGGHDVLRAGHAFRGGHVDRLHF